jgi:hypothetical protein
MKIRGLHFSTVLLVLAAMPVQADIYKCTEADGHVTYSNVATNKCKKLNLEPVNTSQGAKAAPKTPTPATFPKVDDNTQKARDTDRRRILETELAAEQKNLEQAKKDLAEQEATILPSERMQYKGGAGISGGKVEERVQPYKDKVALHERNLEAIRKEIANLR